MLPPPIYTPGWRETAWSEVSFPWEQSDNRARSQTRPLDLKPVRGKPPQLRAFYTKKKCVDCFGILYSFLFYCFPPSQKDHHFVSFHGILELYKVTCKSFFCVCVFTLKFLNSNLETFSFINTTNPDAVFVIPGL